MLVCPLLPVLGRTSLARPLVTPPPSPAQGEATGRDEGNQRRRAGKGIEKKLTYLSVGRAVLVAPLPPVPDGLLSIAPPALLS